MRDSSPNSERFYLPLQIITSLSLTLVSIYVLGVFTLASLTHNAFDHEIWNHDIDSNPSCFPFRTLARYVLPCCFDSTLNEEQEAEADNRDALANMPVREDSRATEREIVHCPMGCRCGRKLHSIDLGERIDWRSESGSSVGDDVSRTSLTMSQVSSRVAPIRQPTDTERRNSIVISFDLV